MPAIITGPPPRDDYNYVMVRYDLAPIRQQKFVAYAETAHSRAIDYRGRLCQGLFCRRRETMLRAMRYGWKDITNKWISDLEHGPPAPDAVPAEPVVATPPPEPTPEPEPEPAEPEVDPIEALGDELVTVLTMFGPMGKKEIMNQITFNDTRQYRKVVTDLMGRERIERLGRGAMTTYAVI